MKTVPAHGYACHERPQWVLAVQRGVTAVLHYAAVHEAEIGHERPYGMLRRERARSPKAAVRVARLSDW